MDFRRGIPTAAGALAIAFATSATAQDLPNWRADVICANDSAPGQCVLFERRARAQVAEAWITIPETIRKGCLSEFRPPVEPSWRIMASCIGELDVAARVAVRQGAIAREIAVVKQLKKRRQEAERTAQRRKEQARREALAAAEQKRIMQEEASFVQRLQAEREAERQKAQRQAQVEREHEEIRLAREEASFLTAFAALKKADRAAEAARQRTAAATESQSTARANAAAGEVTSETQTATAKARPGAKRTATSAGRGDDSSASTVRPVQSSTGTGTLTPARQAAANAKPETLKIERPAEPAKKAKPAPKGTTLAAAKRSAAEVNCERGLAATAEAGLVLFAFDSAELLKDAEITLDALAAGVRACGKLTVTIEGHTDATGTQRYNQRLSERRAENVANYLINAGVASKRVQYIGYGERRPVASNRTSAGRARNRRIEYRVR